MGSSTICCRLLAVVQANKYDVRSVVAVVLDVDVVPGTAKRSLEGLVQCRIPDSQAQKGALPEDRLMTAGTLRRSQG